MNERRKWSIMLVTMLVFVTTAAFLPGLVRAGDLEPSASPGSTMHTLGEIYDKLEQLVPGGLAPVAKTGQTTSYADGDNGDLENGVAWPQPRFTDNGDGTVADNLTGLIWLKNANCFGQKTWTDALIACNDLAAGHCGLTDGSVAGDWRLPNVKELQSLIHFGIYDPALPDTTGTGQWAEGDPFAGVQSHNYWSGTTCASNTDSAVYVVLTYGVVEGATKTSNFYVWPVRGRQ